MKNVKMIGKSLSKNELKNINGGWKTKESCESMGGFWGQMAVSGVWCCTIPGGQSYCPPE
ncbi:bacteriocin [Flavobacterium sp. J27]|uniref:bacteriocin n=1 Tax=Flavobacterium sp. J27 TaxID=2060419 RepID=UPI0010310AEF|nr:bacteriocin [Flavobacterium sp. J27]